MLAVINGGNNAVSNVKTLIEKRDRSDQENGCSSVTSLPDRFEIPIFYESKSRVGKEEDIKSEALSNIG